MKNLPVKIENKEFIQSLDNALQDHYKNNDTFLSFSANLYPLIYPQIDQFLNALKEKEAIEKSVELHLKKNRVVEIKNKLAKIEWVNKELHIINEVLNEQLTERDENGNYKYANAPNSKINCIKTKYLVDNKESDLKEELYRLELELQSNITMHTFDNKSQSYILSPKNKHLILEALNHTLQTYGLTPISFLKFDGYLNKNIEYNDELFDDKDMYEY